MKRVIILEIIAVLVVAFSSPALCQTEGKYVVSGNGTMDDGLSLSLAVTADHPAPTPGFIGEDAGGHMRIHGLNFVATKVKIDCAVSPAATFECNNLAGPNLCRADVFTGGPGEGTIILHCSAEDQVFKVIKGSISCSVIGGEIDSPLN